MLIDVAGRFSTGFSIIRAGADDEPLDTVSVFAMFDAGAWILERPSLFQ
jgi:hypothetical protein